MERDIGLTDQMLDALACEDGFGIVAKPRATNVLTVCNIDGHWIGVYYPKTKPKIVEALRTLGRMTTNPTFQELGYGYRAAATLAHKVVGEIL